MSRLCLWVKASIFPLRHKEHLGKILTMEGVFVKVLLVGRGGREHSIAMKLYESGQVNQIYAAPGNGGISDIAVCADIDEMNIDGLAAFAVEKAIDLTIVGPENPLVAGITNKFHEAGLKFCSDKTSSHAGRKQTVCEGLHAKYDIPTAAYASFTRAVDAKAYINKIGAPVVVKADGLAGGKGVVVAHTIVEACLAVDRFLTDSGSPQTQPSIVIEECLEGRELSLMAFVHENNVFPMLPARDYKRAFDHDQGPNTGGMGAYAPVEDVSSESLDEIIETVLQKAADGIMREGCPFTGILYAGLMMTEEGPKVIEFNARFGDPETEVVLPLLKMTCCKCCWTYWTERIHSFRGNQNIVQVWYWLRRAIRRRMKRNSIAGSHAGGPRHRRTCWHAQNS